MNFKHDDYKRANEAAAYMKLCHAQLDAAMSLLEGATENISNTSLKGSAFVMKLGLRAQRDRGAKVQAELEDIVKGYEKELGITEAQPA